MSGAGDQGRRLTGTERGQFWQQIAIGQTLWEAAEAIGSLTKTVERLLV